MMKNLVALFVAMGFLGACAHKKSAPDIQPATPAVVAEEHKEVKAEKKADADEQDAKKEHEEAKKHHEAAKEEAAKAKKAHKDHKKVAKKHHAKKVVDPKCDPTPAPAAK